MKLYEVDDGEEKHWIIAEDEKAALCGAFGFRGPFDEFWSYMKKEFWLEEKNVSCQPLRDDYVLEVTQDDGVVEKKTVREWVAEGAGIVASTIW